MSGWLGIYRRDGGPIDPPLIDTMMARLRARGPHGESVVAEGPVVLGLTRLDTRERVVTAGAPARFESLLVTGHVRIDARDDVGRALGVPPPALAALSDLELLARAFHRWRDDVPTWVAGEYAACVWDAHSRSLTVVRDGFGVRPAYVAAVGPWALASNTLVALRAHAAVSDALDDEAILELLLLEWMVTPGITAFRDIRLSPTGGTWTATADKVWSRTSWRLAAPPVERHVPWQELARQWRSTLDVATADRVRGAPASISLSGGLDSTAVAASAALTGPDTLLAATEVATSYDDDEGRWAALAARALGIRHVTFSEDSAAAAGFATSPMGTPEPSITPWEVSPPASWRAMAAHAPIVLHGEGGDEIWRATELIALWGEEPPSTLIPGIAHLLRRGAWPGVGLGLRRRLRQWRRGLRGEGAADAVPPWLSPEVRQRFDVERIVREGTALISPAHAGPRRGSLTGLSTALWQTVLVELDAGWSGLPVEVRLPLLDRRVVNAALLLPPVPAVVGKLALRQAMRDRLPAALLERPKTPAQASGLESAAGGRPWQEIPDTAALAYYVDLKRLRAEPGSDAAARAMSLRPVALSRWMRGGWKG